MSGQRKDILKFIAYLQIIGILLVVFGHSFHQYPDGSGGTSLLIYRMMYSFRMPLFMFVSGFLMVYTTVIRQSANSGWRFVRSKMRRLMIPYFFLSVVVFVPRALMSSMADDPIELSLGSFIRSMFYVDNMVIPFFWFLQASFILLVGSHLFIHYMRRAGLRDAVVFFILGSVAIILLVLTPVAGEFFSFNQVCRLGVYFVAGMVYCRWHQRIDAVIDWKSPLTLLLTAAAWVVLFFLTESTPWVAVCSAMGIAMSISVAKMLEYHDIDILDPLIGTNYIIFLLSWFFNVACQQVLAHFVVWPWWVHTVLSIVTAIGCPWLLYQTMRRRKDNPVVRAAAFLLGQSFR